MPLAYTPDQISAFWSGVTALATLAAATVAILTLLALRRDSVDRSRPVMSADLRPVALTKGASELVVENMGQSVAKNVRVMFDPPLPDLQGAEATGKVTPFLRRRYLAPIPSIPVGRRLSNIYSIGTPDSRGILQNSEPTPDDVTIRFEYEDSRGRAYKDSYRLSLNTLRDETGSWPSNTDDAGMRRRQVRALEMIARSLSR